MAVRADAPWAHAAASSASDPHGAQLVEAERARPLADALLGVDRRAAVEADEQREQSQQAAA